jgi:hypothetical protein
VATLFVSRRKAVKLSDIVDSSVLPQSWVAAAEVRKIFKHLSDEEFERLRSFEFDMKHRIKDDRRAIMPAQKEVV